MHFCVFAYDVNNKIGAKSTKGTMFSFANDLKTCNLNPYVNVSEVFRLIFKLQHLCVPKLIVSRRELTRLLCEIYSLNTYPVV